MSGSNSTVTCLQFLRIRTTKNHLLKTFATIFSGPVFVITTACSGLIIIGNFFQSALIAGVGLIGLFSLLVIDLSSRTSLFTGLFTSLVVLVTFAYAVQLFGEIISSFAVTWPFILFLLFSAIIGTSTRNGSNFELKSRVTFGITFLLAGGTWILLCSLRDTTLINFLGYGYDNYGHLAQSFLLMENDGTTLLGGGVEEWPTFIQDAPQVAPSLITTFSQVTASGTAISVVALRILALETLLLPFLAVFAMLSALPFRRGSRLQTASLVLLISVTFLTGYFSRIWLSGYFASNLSTVILIFVAIAITCETPPAIFLIYCAAILNLHTYPLLGLITAILVLPKFSVDIISRLREAKQEPFWKTFSYFASVLLIALTVIVPYLAMRRSFGTSQFLIDGGIEPYPINFWGIWVGYVLFVPSIILASLFRYKFELISLLLVVSISTAVSMYSYMKLGRLSYYPIKILIAMVFLQLVFFVILVSKTPAMGFQKFSFVFILASTLVAIFGAPSQKVFIGGYMGEFPRTLHDAVQYQPSVVQPGEVHQLAMISESRAQPVLYLTSNAESELNTRWINTLSGNWNNSSWSDWIELRTSIEEEDWESASQIALDSQILIVTDDNEIFRGLEHLQPFNLCFETIKDLCRIDSVAS